MTSDVQLLEAWRGGSRDAGRELFERYFLRLSRFFGNKVSDGVEDLIQTTMLACVESRDRIRDDTKFRAYLFRTARNELLAVYGARRRVPEPLDTGRVCADQFCTTPTMALLRREDERLLLHAMRRIPLDFQMLLELHYWENMKTSELAELLGVPHSTAKSRLVRARTLLRGEVEALSASGRYTQTTTDDIESWARRLRSYADQERT